MNDLVSVIIPVYNGETYIERCIESITKQTYKSLEIIAVDDGSGDSTFEKCNKYSRQDHRVKTIHIEKSGVSTARNIGINKSKGSWIIFVDSDDEIAPVFVETLVKAKSALEDKNLYVDFLACEAVNVKDGESIEDKDYKDTFSEEDFVYIKENPLVEYFNLSGFACSVCCKLFRRELFDGIVFPDGIAFGEDARVMTRLCLRAKGMAYTDIPLYIRHINGKSATSKLSLRNVVESVEVFNDRLELIDKMEADTVEFVIGQKLWCLREFYKRNEADKADEYFVIKEQIIRDYRRTLWTYRRIKTCRSFRALKWAIIPC